MSTASGANQLLASRKGIDAEGITVAMLWAAQNLATVANLLKYVVGPPACTRA
jgi:hypothetical protein